MIRVDTSISPRVDAGDAYRLVMWHRGSIAADLRRKAYYRAIWDLIRAENNRCGAKRHRQVKHARDVLKRIRRMELERSGWR